MTTRLRKVQTHLSGGRHTKLLDQHRQRIRFQIEDSQSRGLVVKPPRVDGILEQLFVRQIGQVRQVVDDFDCFFDRVDSRLAKVIQERRVVTIEELGYIPTVFFTQVHWPAYIRSDLVPDGLHLPGIEWPMEREGSSLLDGSGQENRRKRVSHGSNHKFPSAI